MSSKPLGSPASRQCAALTAAADADGTRPAGSAASVGDPHGGSGGAAGKQKRLAVFVSGGGSNMRAIHAATLDGRLPASVEVHLLLAILPNHMLILGPCHSHAACTGGRGISLCY